MIEIPSAALRQAGAGSDLSRLTGQETPRGGGTGLKKGVTRSEKQDRH
jgi:hypothetical protein